MPIRLWKVAVLWGCISILAAPGTVRAAEAAASVALLWTSPGDDGNTGTATSYDLRYSLSPITAGNFAAATRFLSVPAPRPSGTLQLCIVDGLIPNSDYYFAIKSTDERGNWSPISNVAIHTGVLVDVNGERSPLVFSSPWPNPARNSARFSLSLPDAGPVTVEAFDMSGRRVRTLYQGEHPAGGTELIWNLDDDQGRSLGAGMYMVRATLPTQVITRRAVIVR